MVTTLMLQGLYNWVTVSGERDKKGEGALCFYGKTA